MPTFQRLERVLLCERVAPEDRPRVQNQSRENRAASVCRRIYTAARAYVHRCAHTFSLAVTRRTRGRRANGNRNGFVYCDDITFKPPDPHSYRIPMMYLTRSIFSILNDKYLQWLSCFIIRSHTYTYTYNRHPS